MTVSAGKSTGGKTYIGKKTKGREISMLGKGDHKGFAFVIQLCESREGVIIDDDKTTLFNELLTLENIILTSQNDIREMQDIVNNPEPTLGADF